MNHRRLLFFCWIGWIFSPAPASAQTWMLSGGVEIDRIGLQEGGSRQFQSALFPEAAYFPGEKLGVGLRSDFIYLQSNSPSVFSSGRFWRTLVAFQPFFRYYLYRTPQSPVAIFLEGGGGYAWLNAGTELETFDPRRALTARAGLGFGWSPAPGWALESGLRYDYQEQNLDVRLPNGLRSLVVGAAFRLFLPAEAEPVAPREVRQGDIWLAGSLRLEQSFSDQLGAELSPGLGVMVYDAFLAGAHFQLFRQVTEQAESFNWSVEPFGRYYFTLNDRWQIFPHIAAAYQSLRVDAAGGGDRTSLTNLIWRFGTGLNGFLTEAASIEILAHYSNSNLDLDNNFVLISQEERRLGVEVALRYWLLR